MTILVESRDIICKKLFLYKLWHPFPKHWVQIFKIHIFVSDSGIRSLGFVSFEDSETIKNLRSTNRMIFQHFFNPSGWSYWYKIIYFTTGVLHTLYVSVIRERNIDLKHIKIIVKKIGNKKTNKHNFFKWASGYIVEMLMHYHYFLRIIQVCTKESRVSC